MHTGSCLCGAVRFEVACELPGPDACHCTQCRKHSGHFFVSTDVPRSALTIRGEENVRWYSRPRRRVAGFVPSVGRRSSGIPST
jgi:hypothetical protein